MDSEKKKYKVVIECTTFNQRNYIEYALKGFVMQKTDFPFCAVVIDDCSTDGQQEIIQEYAKRYPDIIKPVFLPFNHFSVKKSKQEYLEPFFRQTEYIAKCEGDDYWIDDNKLQMQADFLDNHPECALTYHACINKFEEGYEGVKITFGENVKEEYDYVDLLKNYNFHTATIMLRSSVWFHPFFQKCYRILGYDFIQFFAASQIGTIRGFNKPMSIYRRNNNGISYDIHKSKKSIVIFDGWSKIAELCDKNVRENIHKITLCANLCQISKISMPIFIKYCIKESIYYPGVTFSALLSIIKKSILNLPFFKKK